MFQARRLVRRNLTVTLVCPDADVISGLERYLRYRVSCRVVLALAQASVDPMVSDCVVLYPDGFPVHPVQRFAARLIRSPTVPLVIIVTESPEHFGSIDRGRRENNRLILFSPPAWPWTLFATIESSLPSPRREASQLC